MSKQEEIIEVCGKKVVVRYTRDGQPCEKCVLDGTKGCNSIKCSLLDRVGMEIDERAYFVEAPPPPPLEVTNSLRAEFDKLCPPQPIQGSIAPEADLEAEIERWWNERYAEVDKNYEFNSMSGHYITNETIITLARHFAEWGKTQKLSPQPKGNTEEFDDYNPALLG